MNALAALGLVIATGARAGARRSRRSPRLDRRARPHAAASANRNGAAVFVDYAHTPDALATVLTALRPHAERRLARRVRLRRRPRPRQAAADGRRSRPSSPTASIVTDDNPRSEDPGRDPPRDPRRRARRGRDRRPRAPRSRAAIAELRPGDVLVIAGKGHETGQIVGRRGAAVRRRRGRARDLADAAHDGAVDRRQTPPPRPAAAHGAPGRPPACRSTAARSQPGDLFVALAGPEFRRP